MEYIRKVVFDRLVAGNDRVSQTLIGHDSGASSCSVNCIKAPPGEGSPAGLHTHLVDQLFYILSGTMSLEIEGKRYEAGPGTLAVFPAGVPQSQLERWQRSNRAPGHQLTPAEPRPTLRAIDRLTERHTEVSGGGEGR